MNVTFGPFDDVSDIEFCKSTITNFFQLLKHPKIDQVYVAVPHMLYSDDGFEPTAKSSKRVEIYFFSSPKEVGMSTTRQLSRLHLNGQIFSLARGQGDTINSGSVPIPSEFEEFKDEDGELFALSKANKFWVLMDAMHGVGPSSGNSTELLTAVLTVITEGFTPLSPEEKRKMQEQKFIAWLLLKSKNGFAEVDTIYNQRLQNVQTYQNQYQTALKDFVSWKQVKENLKPLSEDDAKEVIKRLWALPFVEDVSFGTNVVIRTKEITLGPFNYGKWTFELVPTNPSILPENRDLDPFHPYSWGDHGRFCLGGFVEPYATAMQNCDLDKATSILKLLITNYMVTTRMHNLEPFLIRTMGEKEFREAFNELLREHDINPDDYERLEIASILGNEITLTGKEVKTGMSFRKVVKV